MKLLFERETELGPCDPGCIDEPTLDQSRDWVAFALTTAAMIGTKGMLRIEQSCYLRAALCSEDIRPQTWVKSDMALEPMLESKKDTLLLVQRAHEQFVRRAQQEFAEHGVLASPSQGPSA